jgi:hypothetical protein
LLRAQSNNVHGRLRIPAKLYGDRRIIDDIQKCITLLADLESRWSGAGRSRAIIERLLAEREAQMDSQNETSTNPSALQTTNNAIPHEFATPLDPKITAATSAAYEIRSHGSESQPKRSYGSAFPSNSSQTLESGEGYEANGMLQRGTLQEETPWKDIYWSELVSIDDASIAILSDFWADRPF